MDSQTSNTQLYMSRSVSQLLFSYLPGKVVDWEDGLAIVQLRNVRLNQAWSGQKAQLVLNEISRYLYTWQMRGGAVHSNFPNPGNQPERFTVGEPESITAVPLEGALSCRRCGQLVFRNLTRLGKNGLKCPGCNTRTLSQFGQVFVHGCGCLEPLNAYLPWMSTNDDGTFRVSRRPIECENCHKDGVLAIPGRSERARDMAVVCQKCHSTVVRRLVARCPECAKQLAGISRNNNEEERQQATAVGRVAMRLTNSRANDAYYAHTLTILRLDRPRIIVDEDDEIRLITKLLPRDRRPERGASSRVASLNELIKRLDEAEKEKPRDNKKIAQLEATIVTAVTQQSPPETPIDHGNDTDQAYQSDDIPRALEESLAFRTSVKTRTISDVLEQSTGATGLLTNRIQKLSNDLGLNRTRMVDDLPVISTSFGFTRRSFEPTYDEPALNAIGLPTHLRPFYALDHDAARRIDRLDAIGTVPILAREGEHEGLFLSLEPERVIEWLSRNGNALPVDSDAPVARILCFLEPVDRYYDNVDSLPFRRMVFGLLHSLSHAAMRVLSRLAGLERTSLSEYIFLPLLGTAIYANGSTTKLGAMETVMRSRMFEFLESLSDEAMECVYDPVCLDHQGACHGCLHAPEISCRVFNHGLSRSFLMGGHSPWRDASSESTLIGYWE